MVGLFIDVAALSGQNRIVRDITYSDGNLARCYWSNTHVSGESRPIGQ